MIVLGLEPPAELRSAIRRALIDSGLPPDRIDEVADLGILAASDALAAIERAAARAGDPKAQLTILSLALATVEALTGRYAAAMQAAAAQLGMRTAEINVTLGGGGLDDADRTDRAG
ncbi:MAG TPA: hypothetical protein PKD99_02420 [Sphingopyxis sp.]|nr:hypothetical protein [Sphingopyxis sp.]HMP43932.1 hypothetical protein [Sphingopyxis sp.]